MARLRIAFRAVLTREFSRQGILDNCARRAPGDVEVAKRDSTWASSLERNHCCLLQQTTITTACNRARKSTQGASPSVECPGVHAESERLKETPVESTGVHGVIR